MEREDGNLVLQSSEKAEEESGREERLVESNQGEGDRCGPSR